MISGRGEQRALNPKTENTLNILLPMMLPTAISHSLRIAATIEVAASGSEVPPATRVSAITSSLIPRYRAILIALSISHSEPK